MMDEASAKDVMSPIFSALRDVSDVSRHVASTSFAPDALCRLGHPMGEIAGFDALYDKAYAPLHAALPDLERQEFIRIAGRDDGGAMWVGSGGHYAGTWVTDWLGIPASGRSATMRFHEFFRIEDGKCIEMQAVWDIPEMMMQAGVWPMAPQLGRFLHAPAPMTQDGQGPHDARRSDTSRSHVIDMLTAMMRHPSQGGPEVMELDRFWHPKFMWYGPCGIGTARGVEEFRRFHQIPFLNGMPDRGQYPDKITHHFIAEGAYVGVTGWPNMCQTLTGDGWLGIAPTKTEITLRSLDFWRIEDGLIRENWVLVDLLDMYRQIGVDVFARMEEFKWSKGYR